MPHCEAFGELDQPTVSCISGMTGTKRLVGSGTHSVSKRAQ